MLVRRNKRGQTPLSIRPRRTVIKAQDVMTSRVVTVGPGVSVLHAARLMLQNQISGLPVADAGGNLIGIVTEGDLLRRVETGPSAGGHIGSSSCSALASKGTSNRAREHGHFVRAPTARCVGFPALREEHNGEIKAAKF